MSGFFAHVNDWFGNRQIQSCSSGVQGILHSVRLLMTTGDEYGKLVFDKRENWIFDYEQVRKFALSNSKADRETTAKRPRNAVICRELEKRTGIEARVMARALVKLVDKGIWCNEKGYICDPYIIELGERAKKNRLKVQKFREKGDTCNRFVTDIPIPHTQCTSPIVPSNGGDKFPPAASAQKRKRRRPTKTQLDAQVGAETGNGSLAKFREDYLTAGGNPEKLPEAIQLFFEEWEKTGSIALTSDFKDSRGNL